MSLNSPLKSNVFRISILLLALFGIAVTALAFTCFWALELVWGLTPAQEITATAMTVLTATYGEEARAAIASYVAVSGSHYSRLHRETFAEVATNPLLDILLEFDAPERDDLVWVTGEFDVYEVNVIEYTPERMRVFACVTRMIDKLTMQGIYVDTLPAFVSQTFYAFVREEGTWKLATAYGYWEEDDAMRDWVYVSDEEREFLGDLPSYFWQSNICPYSPRIERTSTP